ncbi:sugar phosphate isomerase/epimerase family protein [Natrialba asiatica]|uniref:Xylose isomerase n=1 Tax=Natrialba asiatica (strain ATCC 700177 / DSM 12278 / JCM 9576 / FERM P-10747 / NBRC 102637 / 172P1) TaxID=29540 RepID=M0AX62_NATA1|nr:sugar phosphate isomerase/epimerase family protein [Natrialba asiatica]ELZ01989.1 xylose isomerase [Natrialba asiatica DSM 12278]
MVDLAFSTNAYARHSLSDAIYHIADHGYAGVELLGDEPHAYFPEFSDAARTELRTALDETELAVSNINANTATGYYDDAPPSSFFEPSVIRADADAREWRIDYTKRAIDLADAVDAPAVCLATGRPLPGTPPEKAREYLHESLHDILDYAEPMGVDVGIEFEPELLIENTDETLALIDDLDRDGLGVNLDLGHAAVYGEDVTESIRRSAGAITGVHLEDIVGGRRGKHYHRIPGEGDLDFRAIFDALDDTGYDGFATLELYTHPDDPDRAAREAYVELAAYV